MSPLESFGIQIKRQFEIPIRQLDTCRTPVPFSMIADLNAKRGISQFDALGKSVDSAQIGAK